MIVEDEEQSIELLERYIKRTPGLSFLGYETNPLIAFERISTKKVKPDVVFLDINMPGLTGVDLAKQIVSFSKIVFTSGYSSYGVKAFDIGAFDFLEKPISYDRFLQTIKRLNEQSQEIQQNRKDEMENLFFIKGSKKGHVERIEVDEILYIESVHNYGILYLSNGHKKIIYMSLSEIDDALPDGKFLRVQRSFIINLSKINKIEGHIVYLQSCPTGIHIGQLYKDELLKVIKSRLLS